MQKTKYSIWEVEYHVGTDGQLEPILIFKVEDGIESWREAYARAYELSRGRGLNRYEAFSYEE